MTIGEKIRILRIEKGWNQDFLAKKVGSTKHSISKYEHNVMTPTLQVLKKLSEVFEVSIDYLISNKKHTYTLNDKKLLDYFQIADELPPQKRKLIKDVIKAVSESP